MSEMPRETMSLWFKERFAELAKAEPSQIDGDSPFDSYGIISLDIVYVIAGGMKYFNVKITRADLVDINSINGVVDAFNRSAASTS